MDYEKAYKEALARAKDVHDYYCDDNEQIWKIESIFPELKEDAESEDERILASIADCVSLMGEDGNVFSNHNVTKACVLAYLEKQKEQKPADKQDYSGLSDFERAIHRGFLCAGVDNVPVAIIKETAQECLAQIKPAEWSEEDEKMLKNVLFVLESFVSQSESAASPSLITTYPTYYKEIDWLKSLRPSWKPSEEQMEALKYVNEYIFLKDSSKRLGLRTLYEDLKKLI